MYTPKGQLDRDALLRQHAPLVRRIAHHMIVKLPPNVELDDLIQVGMIGLADALSRFEAQQGVQFETFASQRIRGAMLDELRDSDWMSRSSRKSQKDIEQALHRVEQRHERTHQLQRRHRHRHVADHHRGRRVQVRHSSNAHLHHHRGHHMRQALQHLVVPDHACPAHVHAVADARHGVQQHGTGRPSPPPLDRRQPPR